MAAPVTAGDLTMSYANFNKFVSDANGDPNTIPDRLEERLYVIGESEITRIDVPWPTFKSVAQGFNYVTLYGSDGWVYAYVVNETSNASGQTESSNMTVWRTNDGASWADIGSPSFLSDSPVAGSVHFDLVAEMLVVTISSAYPESGRLPEAAAWESADGVNWVPMPPGRPGGTYPTRLESGWFASDGDKGGSYFGDTLWMQVSGTWVSLADMGMERLQPSDCWVHKTAVGTTTFFRSGGCPGGIASPVEQDILILSLPPAD
jgi:hypothetical protein